MSEGKRVPCATTFSYEEVRLARKILADVLVGSQASAMARTKAFQGLSRKFLGMAEKADASP